ncbi:mechanosensitive ion channel domain-containing protein [Natrinema salinisoli]|uniref:mechanosensitive ion channel domain-containing protein n=1 Tax=Natrinema salinisoli TaxID=2878535 RepID=UPI001CF0967E|nr:mechanosensitive ion channel domain-containing protein [Natrinema salinisoli]
MLIQAVSEPTDEPVPRAILSELIADTITALPKVISGVLFLVVAYLLIKIALWVTRSVLERMHPDEQRLIVDLSVTIVGVFLWFGAALAFLKIVGLGDVAASLGTAGGFIGLGVAFALKEMIADTVAGIYLLRDPDFEVGDTVNTASVTGTVTQIDLRKTRIRADDGTLVVLANRDVEKKWTNESSAASESRVEAPAE